MQNQGHESDNLLRRYPGAGEHGDVTVPAQRLCIEPAAESGVQTQQQEVSDALTGNGMEYNDYASFSSTGQTRSNTTTDRSFKENA